LGTTVLAVGKAADSRFVRWGKESPKGDNHRNQLGLRLWMGGENREAEKKKNGESKIRKSDKKSEEYGKKRIFRRIQGEDSRKPRTGSGSFRGIKIKKKTLIEKDCRPRGGWGGGDGEEKAGRGGGESYDKKNCLRLGLRSEGEIGRKV